MLSLLRMNGVKPPDPPVSGSFQRSVPEPAEPPVPVELVGFQIMPGPVPAPPPLLPQAGSNTSERVARNRARMTKTAVRFMGRLQRRSGSPEPVNPKGKRERE